MMNTITPVVTGAVMSMPKMTRRYKPRRALLTWLAVCLLAAVLMYLGSLLLANAYYPASQQVAAAPAPQSSLSGAEQPNGAIVPANNAGSIPNCVQNSAYSLPSDLDLTSASAGVIQVIDSPAFYDVYGNSVAQIGQQLNVCAPHLGTAGTTYLAYTSYHLSWRYDYTVTENGKCVLSNIKVGQHISQIFPRWNDTGKHTDIANKWQTFSAALQEHEAGHAALDTQYANKLLADLQTLPPLDCASVTATVNTTANSDAAALNQAHANHDATTNHGANEGAIWQ